MSVIQASKTIQIPFDDEQCFLTSIHFVSLLCEKMLTKTPQNCSGGVRSIGCNCVPGVPDSVCVTELLSFPTYFSLCRSI